MSTPKKPKARRMWANPDYLDKDIVCYHKKTWDVTIPVAVLDMSNEEALIEVAAEAMYGGPACWNAAHDYTKHLQRDDARAALTALGILLKRKGKKQVEG